MSATPPQLGPSIRHGLAGLRRRARLALSVRGLASLALLLVLLCLISFGLDRMLRLSWETRATALVLALSAILVVTWRRLLGPLGTVLRDVELAREMERIEPSLEWRLVSAVQFTSADWAPGPETSAELAACVVADAERLAGGLTFGRAVPMAPVVKALLRGVAVVAAAAMLASANPETANTWLERNVLLSTSAKWPQDTYLAVVGYGPGEPILVPQGADLVLEVEVIQGVIPKRVYLDTSGFGASGGDEVLALDALGGKRFRTVLTRLASGFTFHARGGDDRIGPFEVRVIHRPWIQELGIEVAPPAYTKVEARRFDLESSTLTLPAGTRLTLRAKLSKALVSARVEERTVGAEGVATIHTSVLAGDGKGFTTRLTLEKTGVVLVDVEDTDGLGLEEPTRFTLMAEPDTAPTVRMELRGVGLNVTPDASIRFRVAAEDDYGLTSGRLRLRMPHKPPGEPARDPNDPTKNPWGEGGGEEKPPGPKQPTHREASRSLPGLASTTTTGQATDVVELTKLKLAPKMAITLWAEALDNDPRGPNTGSSSSLQLRVVTPEQLLNELLRRLHEQRLELERMVSEEERLAQGLNGEDATTLERAPRTQKDVTRVVLRSAVVVNDTVEEMISNKILDARTWDRLRGEVAQPLRTLASGSLRDALELAETAQGSDAAERAAAMIAAGAAADRAARELSEIVERMGRIEELAEVIALLKRIIQKQRDVQEATRKKEGE